MSLEPSAAARFAATAVLTLGLGLAHPAAADDVPRASMAAGPEFAFARLRYDSSGSNGKAYYHYRGRIWERWETDYPEGDENFAHRLAELTSVVPAQYGVARRITDPDVFAFPFLYLCDPGYMQMSGEERTLLREYLQSGGFLWVDDFWGEAEWWNFEREMAGVLPERGWRDIPADHPILHIVFDLPQAPQIPGADFAARGYKTDLAWRHRSPATKLTPVNFRGWFDEQDRLMVVATHNTDIGDGFEREAYGQWYFETYSTHAYKLGVNIAVYALTH
jgi:hypothetical protein